MTGLPSSRQHFIVTGGAGFIGSHMVDYLLSQYPHSTVTCIDKLSYASGYSLCNLEKAQKASNFRFEQIDLAEDSKRIDSVISQDNESYDEVTIFNFAAESCVDSSFEDPLFFTKNNILSTQNLLEAVRMLENGKSSKSVPKYSLVHISTDEVYGEQAVAEIANETTLLNPSNPYAATKAACDLIIGAYVKSYKLPISIVRANNVYGPRQYPEKLIATIFDRLKYANPETGLEQKIILHGDGSCKRSYLHVRDLMRAVDLVAFSLKKNSVGGEIYNVGTDEEWENLSMVKRVCSAYMLAAFQHKIEGFSKYYTCGRDRLYNDARYSIDTSKITALGWHPEICLDEGIAELIEIAVEMMIKESIDI